MEPFDKLDWDVECTAVVWKKLCSNTFTLEQKRRVVYKVQQLAKGKFQSSQTVLNIPSTLHLYVAKVTKDIRIIWELAIAYSPRLNNLEGTNGDAWGLHSMECQRIYSEIIRVWDVVFENSKSNW